MKSILPDFNQAKILIIGDIMLDRYWSGSSNRISPEAPVPVVNINNKEDRPGGAANVALNITSLGGEARLIGLVGKDEPATVLNNQLSALNIRCDFVELENIPTITKLRVMSRSQQLIRLDFEEDARHIEPKEILKRLDSALEGVNAVILSDYAKGTLEHAQLYIQAIKERNIPIFVDPKGADFQRYQGATLLTPNMLEFETVVGPVKSSDELVEKGQQLIAKYDLQALLITRSENGMTLLQKDCAALHIPTQAKDVYDVTGAGDTVISTLAASVATGKSLVDSATIANIAAGIVVGKLGTSSVSTVELAAEMNDAQEIGYGVLEKSSLLEAVKLAKRAGKKIVMTNGCFDILHAGHVSYLNHAAELGDLLIVAVNTNESVQRLKGPGRPVNPTHRRMAVLSGLGAVDWVTSFGEDTPEALINEIIPDLLVKGGDYKVEEIAGAECVLANGGEVKVLNFEDDCSTTNIINLIRDN